VTKSDGNMEQKHRILVAGHRGLVGSAIVRKLEREGYSNILVASRDELDLRDAAKVNSFFEREQPMFVFLAAAKVGGILANDSFPVEFLRDNLLIEANVMDAAYRFGVRKLLSLGSSCIYPKFAPQPIREEYLLTGALEPTNEWYAIAKIAGIKLCQAYRRQYGFRAISLMPTNLYGPGDNFDLQSSHVLPALLRKFHDAALSGAPEVNIWGSGSPRREFMHVDDLADACLFLMLHYDSADIVNVGTGIDISIRELAEMIQRLTGFTGRLTFDATKPDGMPRKLLDVSKLNALGWTASIPLESGLAQTYEWYRSQQPVSR
jgi:GDP-L-fucose synthase